MALSGKVAIVTGSSSGIGRAIAISLAAAGAKVALAARREDRLHEIVQQIAAQGGVALAVQTDICNRNDVARLVKETEEKLGPVDILVNNAGVFYLNLLKTMDDKQTDAMIDINIKGTVNCTKEVAASMIRRKTGHIVFISSDGGKIGFKAMSIYVGSKFFMEGFAQSIRKELVKDNIRVTVVAPGAVNTEVFDNSSDKEALEVAKEDLTFNQILEPDDIARSVTFAVSQPPHVAVNDMLVQTQELPI